MAKSALRRSNRSTSGRRGAATAASPYSSGNYVEFLLNNKTVTGRIVKKSGRGWIIQPSDRRRKQENIEEDLILGIVDVEEAVNNKGATRSATKKGNAKENATSSDGSGGDGEGSNSSDPVVDDASPAAESKKKRKSTGKASWSDEGGIITTKTKKRKSDTTADSDKAKTKRKTVTFKESKTDTSSAANSRSPKNKNKNATTNKNAYSNTNNNKSKTAAATRRSARIGTRSSTRNSDDFDLLPLSLPVKKKKVVKVKKIKKDENVKVVKMLTGTLYLYRGERPRAEFIRFK